MDWKKLVGNGGVLYFLCLLFFQGLLFSCNNSGGNGDGGSRREEKYKFKTGQIVAAVPDTLAFGKTGVIRIRISEATTQKSVLLEKLFRDSGEDRERLITDTIPIGQTMQVNVREAADRKVLDIKRANNNDTQVINTAAFSEWTFFVTPVNYGEARIVISASIVAVPYDIPVYEKSIIVVATGKEKATVFVHQHYLLLGIGGILLFVLLLRLIPKQIIIDDMTNPTTRTNFWAAGSLGLVIYLLTIASLVVFKLLDINLAYCALVFAGAALLFVIFTAVSMRDSGKLSEKSFLQLMGMALKLIPPLNLFFKNKPS